jgi:hypothetical protein
MTNRATRLSDTYVQALNQIDLEFSDAGKDKKVIEKWRALFGELNNAPADTEGGAVQYAWIDRCNEKLMQLLLAMSGALGRAHTEEEIRRGIYYPKGRVDLEQSQLAIIHGLNRIISGEASLPMKITEVPGAGETAKLQTTLNEKMLKAYDEDGSLKVRVQSSGTSGSLTWLNLATRWSNVATMPPSMLTNRPPRRCRRRCSR